jgi:hypothetical protein
MRKVLFLTFCGLIAAPIAANAQDQLPPGPGMDTTVRVCTACHGTAEFTAEHHDAEGWGAVVSQMIGEGANATDDEQAQIIGYLTTNFPNEDAAPAAPAAAAPATPDAAAAPAAPAGGSMPAAPAGGSMPAAPAGGSMPTPAPAQ